MFLNFTKRSVTFLMVLLLFTSHCYAQNNLRPDASYITASSQYALDLRKVFSKGFERDVVLRVIVFPALSPEYMIGIKKKSQQYELFMITPSKSISEYNSDNRKKLEGVEIVIPSKISVETKAKVISSSLALRVREVLKEELLKVRYSRGSLSIDGYSYHFSMFVKGYGDISGRLDSDQESERMRNLSNLAITLKGLIDGQVKSIEVSKALTTLE